MSVADDMNVYLTRDKIIFSQNGKADVLVIDRSTRSSSIEDKIITPNTSPNMKVCGILGQIRLIGGWYLVVATYRLFVGHINDQVIWRLAGHELIPFALNENLHLSAGTQREQNESYKKMLKYALDSQYLFFSYSYNLSVNIQRRHLNQLQSADTSLYDRSNKEFVWNHFLLDNFYTTESKHYCLPLIQGFVSVQHLRVRDNDFKWILISRRSINRAGPRFLKRGITYGGSVANFVETEQIVEYDGQIASFVQIRGSIPLFWNQYPDLKYKPPMLLDNTQDHLYEMTLHFEHLIRMYGKPVCINLIDNRGKEQALAEAFPRYITQMNKGEVRYEYFDFHSECRKMRWDRLNILLLRLDAEIDAHDFFHLSKDGTVLSQQTGVYRTNCIDCLDRTNVVQSMLANRSLKSILNKFFIMDKSIGNWGTNVDMVLKGVWADHADAISIQYSGTGALKTDFTRTGKRSWRGVLNDGFNSLTRYYMNNFSDGYKQDSIDLILGNYQVSEDECISSKCPLIVKKSWMYKTFPSVLLFAVTMFFASVVFPHEYRTENLLFILFWGSMVFVSGKGILKFGKEFVDWPRLKPVVHVHHRMPA